MSTYIQVRTNQSDKEAACKILAQLGTNISSVVNMLLKQIIITQKIPFEIGLKQTDKTPLNSVDEVKASLAIENMVFTEKESDRLLAYSYSSPKEKSIIRQKLLAELSKK